MRYFNFLIFILVIIINNDFLDDQKNFPRVRNAISEKIQSVQKLFKDNDIEFPPKAIYIRIFKSQQSLELWAQSSKTDTFQLIKSYSFCTSSGILGPKRRQGDYQIPEGFYYIDRFNPLSSFHLSLGINYPNKLDRKLGKQDNLGGDIFIHGDCVTIGCIPITDDLIKELYLVAVFTKDNGQDKIPVHIFPVSLTKSNFNIINQKFNNKHFEFWKNLKEGFDYFESKRQLPVVAIKNNKYIFK